MNAKRERAGSSQTMALFKAALLAVSLGSAATTAQAVPEFPAVCESLLQQAASMQKGAGFQEETTEAYVARVKGQMNRCYMLPELERDRISTQKYVDEARREQRQFPNRITSLKAHEANLATTDVFICMCKNASPDRSGTKNRALDKRSSAPIAQPSKGTHIDETCTEANLSHDALAKGRALTQAIRDSQVLADQKGAVPLAKYQAVFWGVPKIVDVVEEDCKTGRSRFAAEMRETYARNMRECLSAFSETDCQPRSPEQLQTDFFRADLKNYKPPGFQPAIPADKEPPAVTSVRCDQPIYVNEPFRCYVTGRKLSRLNVKVYYDDTNAAFGSKSTPRSESRDTDTDAVFGLFEADRTARVKVEVSIPNSTNTGIVLKSEALGEALPRSAASQPKIGPPAPPLCEETRMQAATSENQKIDDRLATFNQSALGQSAHVLPKLQVIMWAAQEQLEALRAACEGRQNSFSEDIAKLQRTYQETKANCEKLASGDVCVAMSPEQITAAVEAEAQGNAARRAEVEAEAAARTTGTNPPLAPIDNSCSGDHSLTEYMMCQRMRCRDQGLIPVDAEGCVICGNVEGSKGEGFAWQKCHPSSKGGSAAR